MRGTAASGAVTVAPMPTGHSLALLDDVAGGERRDGPPELVIRCKHSVVAMPVLPRRRHEIGKPIEELKRRELDDAAGPRPCGLPRATRIAPRLSNTVSIFQFGGMRTPAGRLAGLGVISPRISPLVAMARMPLTPTATRMAMLTLISPRATAMVGMLKGMQTYSTSMKTTAGGLR